MATKRKDTRGRVLREGEDQLSNGMYRYRYSDSYGRHTVKSWRLVETDAIPKGTRNKNPPLRKIEEEITRKQLNGLNVYLQRNICLNDYFDKYMESKKNLRQTTRTNYIYSYDHAARNTIGLLPIGKITYSVIRDFYFDLIYEHDYAPRSIEVLQTVLHPLFAAAVRDDILLKNPADAIAEVKANCDWKKQKRHALTDEQQSAFIDFYNGQKAKEYRRWIPLFTTLFGTGMRIGEAIGLRWCDIDFENNTIDINHELVYYKDCGINRCEFLISEPKTENGYRKIPMLSDLRRVLLEEYQRQEKEGFCISEVDGYSGFVFVGRKNQVISRVSANRAIERIRCQYNKREEAKAKEENRKPLLLPHFSAHNIRHSFASRIVEGGKIDAKFLQQIMGHSDISTTMDIYAEVSSEKLQSVTVEKLDGSLKII